MIVLLLVSLLGVKLPQKEDLWQPHFPEVSAFTQVSVVPRRFFLHLLNLKCFQLKIIFIPTLGFQVGQPIKYIATFRDFS